MSIYFFIIMIRLWAASLAFFLLLGPGFYVLIYWLSDSAIETETRKKKIASRD